MPLRNYGLLTGLVTGFGPQGGGNPHHLLDVSADNLQYRIAINLGPSARSSKSDMQYQIVADLQKAGSAAKALVSKIKNISAFRVKETSSNLPTLDYIHGQIVNMKAFRPLPSGSSNSSQFGKKIADLASAVAGKSDAFVAVFGTGYPDQDDRITGRHQQINPLQDSVRIYRHRQRPHEIRGAIIGSEDTPTLIFMRTDPIRMGPYFFSSRADK